MTVTPQLWEDREEGAAREKEVEDELSKCNDLVEQSGGSCPWPAPLSCLLQGPPPAPPNLQSPEKSKIA